MNNFLHRSLREERIAWVLPKTITQKSKQMLSLFYTQACEKQAWTTCARWNWLAESPANVISLLQLMPPSSNSKHRVCPENCLSVVPINTVSLHYLTPTSSNSKQHVCPVKLYLSCPNKYCPSLSGWILNPNFRKKKLSLRGILNQNFLTFQLEVWFLPN